MPSPIPQVLSFSPPGGGLLLSDRARAQASATAETSEMARLYHARILKLQQELADLEGDVQKERQRWAPQLALCCWLAAGGTYIPQPVVGPVSRAPLQPSRHLRFAGTPRAQRRCCLWTPPLRCHTSCSWTLTTAATA